MKRLAFFLVFFAWTCSTTKNKGKTEALDSPKETKLSEDSLAPIALTPSSLPPPILRKDSFEIGALKLPKVAIDSQGSESQFKYKVCQSSTSELECEENEAFVGGVLLPDLKEGAYVVAVQSCLKNQNNAITDSDCGVSAKVDIVQEKRPVSELNNFLEEAVQISRDIKVKAKDIYQVYTEYKEKTRNQAPTEFSRNIDKQLLYGPKLLAFMINSSQFPVLYKQMYGLDIAPQKSDADIQAQLDSLTKQVQELSNSASKDKPKEAYSAGALLISFGITAVVAGTFVTGIAWYLPKVPGKLDAGADKLSSVIDQSFEAVRKMLYGSLGYGKTFDEALLREKLGSGVTEREEGGHRILAQGTDTYVIESFADGRTRVYQKGSGLIVARDLNVDSLLSDAQYHALPDEFKADFVKSGEKIGKIIALFNTPIMPPFTPIPKFLATAKI